LISWISQRRTENKIQKKSDGETKKEEVEVQDTTIVSADQIKEEEAEEKEEKEQEKEIKIEGSNFRIVVTPVLESQPAKININSSFCLGSQKKQRQQNKKRNKCQQLRKQQLNELIVATNSTKQEEREKENNNSDSEDSEDDGRYFQNNRFGSVFSKQQQKQQQSKNKKNTACNNNVSSSSTGHQKLLSPKKSSLNPLLPKSPISNASECSSIDSDEQERFERAVSSGEFYLGDSKDREYDDEEEETEYQNDQDEEECNNINGDDDDDEENNMNFHHRGGGLPAEDDSLPVFVMLVGIPGGGKSKWCENFEQQQQQQQSENENNKFTIIHSDEVRAELTGNINDQTQNDLVWATILARVQESLRKGVHTILDATNVDTIRRRTFVNQLPPCRLRLKVFFVKESVAKSRIAKDLKEGKDRSAVPDKVLCFMMKKFKESLIRLPEEGWRTFPY
jgi:predicted kinase